MSDQTPQPEPEPSHQQAMPPQPEPVPTQHVAAARVEAGHTPAEASTTAPMSGGTKLTLGIVAGLAVGALVGGVSGAGVAMWATSNNGTPLVSGGTATSITVNDAASATLVTAVAAKASPSIVTINVSGETGAGTGSGIVLSEDGYVLTNNHVVALDGSTANPTVTVTLSDGRLYGAEIVGTDPLMDLAVIKIDGADHLQAAEFGDSTKLNVGDTAIVIGAPLGLNGSVSDGVVSALNRSITVASSELPSEESDSAPSPDEDQGEGDIPFDFWNFGPDRQATPRTGATGSVTLPVIQTDAAINPGNSGGALLDSDGRVIGIVVAIATAGGQADTAGSIGVGFAIPAAVAQRVFAEIIETGTATHGLLGVSVLDVTEDEAQADAGVIGASVQEVTPGSGADAAGLRKGDIVTRLGGLPITGKSDLTAQVRSYPEGGTTELVYVRDGKAYTVEVKLGGLA